MPRCPRSALIIVGGFVLALIARSAEPRSSTDPYANDPYWYKPGHASTPADDTAIKTAPGFEARRILTVPREMGSWTALCVDPQGRFIVSAQQIPGLFRVTPPPLNDAHAEARVEKLGGEAATIGWSHGLLYAFDSLYVTVAEENEHLDTGVYRLEDTDRNGEFDRSTLLFKLDGKGEHGPHNIVPTPDGKSLAIMIGNGTKVPDDVRHRWPVATEGIDHLMPPGFESSSYSTQGWVMRFDPDGTNREVLLSGLRNSFDLAFDQAGDLFTFDSDAEWDLGTPWYRPTRIAHLVSGGEYGWRDDAAVWPDYFEDSVAPVLNIGPGSPSGLVFGYGAKFPERFQRALFVCDWTFATIHAVFLQPHGASHRAEVTEFVGGAGLPVTDVVIGHDGALYFVVGGRRLGSAIYRVQYVGNEPVDPISPATLVSDARARRITLENYHGRRDPAVVDNLWADLGSGDRALRFAARIALEHQPVSTWRDAALNERDVDRALTALLALARQDSPEKLAEVTRACTALRWQDFSAEQKLRALRIYELALARGGDAVAADKPSLRPLLTAQFPDPDARITRELSRLRCALGDTSIIDPVLALMAADTGEGQAMGAAYFERNPKYGQAVRDMLESAPVLERMHHAQMLLWLAEEWTPPQRTLYFQLLADAVAFSKGGHRYAEFWRRIRDVALERTPESERETLSSIGAQSALAEPGKPVASPKGPGREWTVNAAADLASGRLIGREFKQGKAMFAATGCVSCHRLGNEGGTIGPDLSGLGQRFTVRDILEAVIEPSRAISDQYRMVMLQTKDGRTHSGRILSRDARATRIAPNLMRPSQTVAVANDSIASEQTLPVSVMPSGLVNTLNETELLDLLAYLVSAGDPGHRVFNSATP